ncbi:CGNR zinc finger domain-containing protein [Mesorhizobium sp. CO1-1-4]|uniref:CGNR zinc finger domain-containing protein n=1 Tax=Mesorhizobium sp. CO1-1-4 TaxID=2876633 RepID=UPI001CCFDBD8|nr:CGNR zinc finger domain-containing protein [Mesorhizobium sp. CO1-1-4]
MRQWSPRSFIGGHPVLDFLNTAGGDTKARDVERLETFSDVLSWAAAANVIDAIEHAALARLAEASPQSGLNCLQEMRIHRESVYNFITAAMQQKPIFEVDLAQIESSARAAISHARLVVGPAHRSTWQVDISDARLSLVKFRLDLATSALITDPVMGHIRQCETCSWLFLDPSATKRRRWCSMAVCGNRAKALRHYHRTRGT